MADLTYYSTSGIQAGDTHDGISQVAIRTFKESELTHPSHSDGFVDRGDAVYLGEGIVGMALQDATAATDYIDVVTGGLAYVLVDDSAEVAPGDLLYIAATTAVVSGAFATGSLFYGIAYGAVTAGSTAGKVIPVDIAASAPSSLADVKVELAGMADLARGSLIVGGVADAPSALDAKTSGRILVGDGTDLKSVAVSGDATLAANGALTIANDAVSLAKLANITRGSIIVGEAADAPTLLDAKTSGRILVGDGTDLKSVAVSGDATLASSGALSIGANKITSTMMDAGFIKLAEVALTPGNQNAFAFAWQNPLAVPIIVHRLILDVTTAGGSASAVMDIGSAADATTTSDNLVDGFAIDAQGIVSNLGTEAGTNAKAVVRLDANGGTTDFITGQIKTANAAALAGNVYIFYTAVQ